MRIMRHGAAFALVFVCLFGALRYPGFSTPENVLNVLRQNSMLAFVALGMTAVILAGGIDLSVGSLMAAGGLLAAMLSPYGALIAILAAVACAGLLGCFNGLLIARMRTPAFIVTLATMIAVRGAALGITGENSVRVDTAATGLIWLGRGWLGPLLVPVILFCAAYALGSFALRYTTFGRHLFAAGDDQDAARLLGLKVDRVLVAAYALSGALSGFAGVVLAGRLGAGQPAAGVGWELDAIAAVVVGGTLLTGGQAGVERTLVGVLLLGVILNLLNLQGTFSPWWQWVIRGVFLLGVVALTGRTSRSVQHA